MVYNLLLGGLTEEKKVAKRKILAKWLKENILRLGPTFIKIGQQFSTRVDILPQEYVDQLSELQVIISLIYAFTILWLGLLHVKYICFQLGRCNILINLA